ncbi:MAG: DEAD/DEAH box helicase [Bacteroides cellulosilyticus]
MEIQDILRNLQIEQLTPMQEATREAYRENKDLVLLSPTGSGKTLAFLLPLVQTLKTDAQGVQAVVLVSLTRTGVPRLKRCSNPWGPRLKRYELLLRPGRPAMEEHRTMKGIHPSVINQYAAKDRMNDHLRKRISSSGHVTR